MAFLNRVTLTVFAALIFCSCSSGAPPRQFHGRAQPSSLGSFFERALCLVNEVTRLLGTAENQEDVVEYCITRLENLLSNCVNLFHLIDEQQYNEIIDAIQNYIFVLRSRASNQGGENLSNSAYNAPVHNSRVGRPRYEITFDQLSFLVGENFNTPRIAECLGVSVSTVRRRLRDNGIWLDESYSYISDAQLDQLIINIRSHFPRIGCRQMRAMLEADHNVRIQRHRVRMAMRRVDPAGAAIRWSEVHVRRRYNVYGANALWHIDTHHSLIRWRLVIAGGIDGYSRLISYLQCFDNNRASTVVQCFYQSTRQYGFPSRVRSDRGGENYLVSVLMCMVRGTNRGSLIAGRSVHNQRIERLWRDVFWFCISTFYFLFYFMEELGVLDNTNELHLFALHFVFIPRINNLLYRWMEAYNRHPLGTEHNSTPRQLWVESMLGMQNSHHTAPGGVFDRDTVEGPLEQYGIDWEGPCPHSETDLDNVTVPRIDVNIPPNILQHLRESIDPLAPSELFGMDIYLICLRWLQEAREGQH